MKTVNDKLCDVMLTRLLQMKNDITYIQYSTVLNCVITLFNKGKLINYRKYDENKKNILKKWVYRYL